MHTLYARDRAIAERRGRGKNRQWHRHAHELGALDGDAFNLGNAPCFDSTQPEWPISGEHRRLYRHREQHGRWQLDGRWQQHGRR